MKGKTRTARPLLRLAGTCHIEYFQVKQRDHLSPNIPRDAEPTELFHSSSRSWLNGWFRPGYVVRAERKIRLKICEFLNLPGFETNLVSKRINVLQRWPLLMKAWAKLTASRRKSLKREHIELKRWSWPKKTLFAMDCGILLEASGYLTMRKGNAALLLNGLIQNFLSLALTVMPR